MFRQRKIVAAVPSFILAAILFANSPRITSAQDWIYAARIDYGTSGTILQVDPETGDRVLVSGYDRGSGPSLESINGLAVEDGERLLAISKPLVGGSPRVIRIELATGDREIVSDATHGSGTTLGSPYSLAGPSGGDFFYRNSFTDIVRLDPDTGDRTTVSSNTLGDGPSYVRLSEVAVETSGTLLVTDTMLDAILVVDLTTGDRHILSSSSVGSGTPFSNPASLAINPDDEVYCHDIAPGRRVNHVDRDSGDRTDAFNASINFGAGLASQSDGRVLVSSNCGTIAGAGLAAILRIDSPTTYTAVSSISVGSGPTLGQNFTNFNGPGRIAYYSHPGAAEVWVDFLHSDIELGTFVAPYKTLAKGVNAVSSGGTLKIKTGSTSVTPTLNAPMRIEAHGGTVRIGAPAAPPDTIQETGQEVAPTATRVEDWVKY